jgi:two-component system nitrate/nitrite response regulator NarP
VRDHLTPREAEVLALVRQGLPNKLIAHALVISECTVKIHIRNLLLKAGCTNRTQLAVSTLHHSPSPPEETSRATDALSTA